MSLSKKPLQDLANKLERIAPKLSELSVAMGFDAFVDETIRIVGERSSPESYTPMPTIGDFGAWATASAGRSGLREFVLEKSTAGGCTVNMGDGIATMGFPLNAFSGVGDPMHPVFEDFASKCASVDSISMQPGRAIVTEFDDGKLMLCGFSHFSQFTPDFLRHQFADGRFRKICEQSAGIAMTSWSVYPHMTDCWKYLYQEALAGMAHRPQLFFDLADPASRSLADLSSMIAALRGFEQIGRVTLSVNLNEANQIARALEIPEALNEQAASLESLARSIRIRAEVSEVSIHLVKCATTSTAEGAATVEGPFSAKPKRSVGAGDRFNAGFFAGQLLNLAAADCLRLGAASSGYFVRNAHSATWEQLIQFICDWADSKLL